MKIGFYGDSYCMTHPFHNHPTYIDIISKKLNAEIVNIGYGGSSIWDVFLNQFDHNNVPDICVFCWTNSSRLYHPKYRDVSARLFFSNLDNTELHQSLIYYYKNLHNGEKTKLETTSIFYWFDNEILSKLQNKKIIHFWSVGERDNLPKDFNWADINLHHPDKISYYYRWKNGIEVRPALLCLSLQGNTLEQNTAYMSTRDVRLNHLEEPKHQILVSWIEQALDQYQDGLLLDFSNDIKF